MLFHAEMDVALPHDMPNEALEALKLAERQRFQELQKAGTWRHIWRLVGQYSNISIFDVPDNEALHAVFLSLPMYPYMKIRVRPLCRHPSFIYPDDR